MRKITSLLPLAFLTAVLVLSNYFFLKTITSKKPTSSPKLQSSASTGGRFLKTYAAEFMKSQGNITREEALEQARHFDLIAPQINTYSRDTVTAMKAANPNLIMLVYDNAAYRQQNEGPGTGVPEEWYARSSDGCFLRSKGFGNWLMDTSHSGWITNRVNDSKNRINERGFDGVIYDLLGIAPIRPNYNRKDGRSGCTGSGVPAKPGGGGNWSRAEWLNNVKNIARQTKAEVGGKIVAGNGLDEGQDYFELTKGLFDVGDIMMAETWLRNAPDPIGQYPNESQWKKDVDMLKDAGSQGKTVLAMVKVWDTDNRPAATQAQKEAWHKFSLASFLLGTDGNAMFSFRYDHGKTMSHPWWKIDIGTPNAEYTKVGSVYYRTFSNGMALVNPTNQDATFPLPKTFKKLSGEDVNSVSLPSHTGEILLGEGLPITVTPTPGDGGGLTGFYFNMLNYNGLQQRTGQTIDFDWGDGRPDVQGIENDYFGAVWVGELRVSQAGEYTFYTLSDDIVQLWVGDTAVINNFQPRTNREDSARMNLEAGRSYRVKLIFIDLTGPAAIKLFLSGPGLAKQIIPVEYFSPLP